MTPEERALLPKVIKIWERRLEKEIGKLSELDKINAQIAIYEARRALLLAKEDIARVQERISRSAKPLPSRST